MSIRTDLRGTRGVTVVALAFAAVYLVIGIVKHDRWLTVVGPLIMVGYLAVLYAFRSRSEPAALLAGAQEDERQRQVVTLACAAMGNVLVLATVLGFLVALIVGNATAINLLSGLGALGGATFAVAVFWYSRRR
jgi:hypothetical protein